MKYIVFAKTKNGIQIAKELKDEGEDVVLIQTPEDEKVLDTFDDKTDCMCVFDTKDLETSKRMEQMGFEVSFDDTVDTTEEDMKPIKSVLDLQTEIEAKMVDLKESVKGYLSEGAMDKVIEAVNEFKNITIDQESMIIGLDKKTNDSLNIIKEELNKRLDNVKLILENSINKTDSLKQIENLKSEISKLNISISDLGDKSVGLENLIKGFGKVSKDILGLIDTKTNKSDIQILKTDIDTEKNRQNNIEEKQDKEIDKIKEEIKNLWEQLKIVAKEAYAERSGIVQGTTRLRLFLAGVSLNDIFNELNFIAGPGITLTSLVNTTTRKTDLTITSFTNKRNSPRIYSAVSIAGTPGVLTPEIDTSDYFELTAQAAALNIANHVTSTPTGGEKMIIAITSDATPRALTYGTNYVAKGGISLPTVTVANKTTTLGFIFNAGLGKWNLLAYTQE